MCGSLVQVKNQHPQAVKEATASVLPVWLEAFKVLLLIDPQHDVSNSDNWDDLGSYRRTRDKMDVDTPTSLPSSPPKRSAASHPASSSADKRAKILLSNAQPTTLNDKMKIISQYQMWQSRLQDAENDEHLMRFLVRDVLLHLTPELASTNMNGSDIVNLSLDRVDDIVESFNEDELEQWKA
jgi:hypothetical protein